MDKKISVLNLVEELAQQCNMTQTAADEFIRTFSLSSKRVLLQKESSR